MGLRPLIHPRDPPRDDRRAGRCKQGGFNRYHLVGITAIPRADLRLTGVDFACLAGAMVHTSGSPVGCKRPIRSGQLVIRNSMAVLTGLFLPIPWMSPRKTKSSGMLSTVAWVPGLICLSPGCCAPSSEAGQMPRNEQRL